MIGRPLIKSLTFLRQKILSPIKHHFKPKQFRFITLPQLQNHQFISFPHEQWRITKSQNQQQGKFYLFCLFMMAFFVGDWLYTFKHNENVMYFYYVNYPLAMKLLQFYIAETQNLVGPFSDAIPKEKYEIPLVWSKLRNAIFHTEDKQKTKNQNLQQLKQQLQQMDQKLL